MKETRIDLLWRLGIEPRLTGYQYYLDAFEKIKAGMKIDPCYYGMQNCSRA